MGIVAQIQKDPEFPPRLDPEMPLTVCTVALSHSTIACTHIHTLRLRGRPELGAGATSSSSSLEPAASSSASSSEDSGPASSSSSLEDSAPVASSELSPSSQSPSG